MASVSHDVIVVGGGIAGLATAIALARHSKSIRVFEASSQEEFENVSAGAAVQLSPNGLTALQRIGGTPLLTRVLENSSEIKENAMICPSRQQLYDCLQTFPPDPPNQLPTVMIRWGVLRQILATALAQVIPDALVFGQPIIGAIATSAREARESGDVNSVLWSALRFASKATIPISPDTLVVIADGKSSSFRSTSLKSSHRINFKAVVAQRALLPNNSNATYAHFASNGVMCFLGPAGPPEWTYWAISVAESILEQHDALWLKNNTTPEETKSKLLSILQDTRQAEVQAFLDLIQSTPASAMIVVESSEAQLTPSLILANNAVLMGDAAHPMNPAYGQVASFALEDAATLAHCLSASSQGLQQYSTLRRRRRLEMDIRSQERARKAMKGETADDATTWIHSWDVGVDKVPQEDEPMTVVG